MKKIYFSFVIILITIIFVCSTCNLSPGSYPNAEKYNIRISEAELINAILLFKKNYPDYCVPTQIDLRDGRSNNREDHWYHIYFYYKDENKILTTWIRQRDRETTTFALVAINDGLDIGHCKEINKDFTETENELQKQMFEQRILEVIKKNLNTLSEN